MNTIGEHVLVMNNTYVDSDGKFPGLLTVFLRIGKRSGIYPICAAEYLYESARFSRDFTIVHFIADTGPVVIHCFTQTMMKERPIRSVIMDGLLKG